MHLPLKYKEKSRAFDNLPELYRFLEIPVDGRGGGRNEWFTGSQFGIHQLIDITDGLPCKSPLFTLNSYAFVFVKDAHGRHCTDGRDFIIRPGMLYFISPGHQESFEWCHIRDVRLLTINTTFLKEYVHADIFEEFPFLLADQILPEIVTPEIYPVFDHLYRQFFEEYVFGSPYRNKIVGNLLVIFLLKIKEYFCGQQRPGPEANRSAQIVNNFKKTMEYHYRDLVNGSEQKIFRVQDYATAQNLHPNYLSYVIKNKTGKSISAWITDKTIAEAKSLLKNSPVSIKEIACQLGFAEPAHFSNYFKKHTNLSPVSWRKQAFPVES